MITTPYNITDFAFTLDDVFIDISTATADTYFTLKLTVKHYDFYSATLITTVKDYKLPLYNLATKFNIGRIVHRIMGNISAPSALAPQYKMAVVDLTFKELNSADHTLVAQTDYVNFKFIAGVLPALLEANKAILTTNTNVSRVTPTGVFNVSILIPTGAQDVEIFKNGILANTKTFTGTALDNVFTDTIDMAALGAAHGDVIKYTIKGTALFKEVVIDKEATPNYNLLFRNEFKLLESLQCTGEILLDTKYTRVTHNYKRDLVDVLEIIKTTKVKSFKINTGWLLDTDYLTIDSILDSFKAWLQTATQDIELIPVDKKLVDIDSKKKLYKYDLKFQINRASDAQNYTL